MSLVVNWLKTRLDEMTMLQWISTF